MRSRVTLQEHRAHQEQESAARRAASRSANLQALATIPARTLHRAVMSGSCTGVVQGKLIMLQHQGYMAVVRTLPCAHCGKPGPSQFCHADMNKGVSIKTDCRRGFPGCPACHVLLGSTGKIPRAARRILEATYGAATRAKVIALGLWPKRLPMWSETP